MSRLYVGLGSETAAAPNLLRLTLTVTAQSEPDPSEFSHRHDWLKNVNWNLSPSSRNGVLDERAVTVCVTLRAYLLNTRDTRERQEFPRARSYLGVGAKAGLWTLDWTHGLDCGLRFGLDFGLMPRAMTTISKRLRIYIYILYYYYY